MLLYTYLYTIRELYKYDVFLYIKLREKSEYIPVDQHVNASVTITIISLMVLFVLHNEYFYFNGVFWRTMNTSPATVCHTLLNLLLFLHQILFRFIWINCSSLACFFPHSHLFVQFAARLTWASAFIHTKIVSESAVCVSDAVLLWPTVNHCKHS